MTKVRTKKRNKKKNPQIRIGDTVQVISGKDRGTVGEVLDVDWKRERVLVKGVNVVKRHVKPNAQNQQGGIFDNEAPVHYSNVLLYNSELKRGVRIRIDRQEGGIKKRICVKTSNIIE
ncbi:50S ribosomal protein L24 [Deltaproteobacteria bacterium TL4]